jgi:hypothetical protein
MALQSIPHPVGDVVGRAATSGQLVEDQLHL